MRATYSKWDGSQTGIDLDAAGLFGEITDDLLYHGDLDAALRRLLHSGFELPDSTTVAGIRELLDRLNRRKREVLSRGDLGGVYSEIAQELQEVVGAERDALQKLLEDAEASGDQRRREIARATTAERSMRLDLLPDDLAGRVKGLQSYEFTSLQAQQRFEELLARLRSQVTSQLFDRMSGALSNADPESLERTRQALDALNRMIEQHLQSGELDPSFEEFMSRFGDMFPGNPGNLEELLDQLAQRMAATQAMIGSMTPEQRAQLQALAEELLGDMDLRWQVDRLAGNLARAVPSASWGRSYGMQGSDPLGFTEAISAMEELGEIDRLEAFLRSASAPGALVEVDLEQAARLLGKDGARSIEQLARLARSLEEAGLIERREGRFELTPKGMRRIGQNALRELFSRLDKDRLGRHADNHLGAGHERTGLCRPYELGDAFNLHLERTVHNAIRRRGGGVPVQLEPGDFEVEQTENLTRSATVLMVDLSLSMPMRDNFLAAKKVAMALHSLISTWYRGDYLGIVGFSEVAREISPSELPEVSWDFVYGTNMQHGFMLARRMLSRQRATRQIIMITDGEPTAHILDSGEVFFNYPPVRQTVDATLTEVLRCTKEGITINTFMLDATPYLQHFVEQMTKLNKGRVFFTTPETLGDYVLVDFINNQRSTRRRSA